MEQLITRTLESLFFPPGVFILLLVLALLLMRWRKVAGQRLLWVTLGIIYLMTTPLVAQSLTSLLERSPALTAEQIQKNRAQVIVVLAGDRYRNAPEYGGDTVGESTLVRIRYGAWLHHKTGLPLLVSGGHVFDRGGDSLAATMARVLREEYSATEVWLEDKSRTTAENALYSQEILATKGITTIYLVSHASHMLRATAVFERTGLTVIPAPTQFATREESYWLDLLPTPHALVNTTSALHELIGIVWYRIRH